MGLSFEGLQQSINSPVATDVGPSLAVLNVGFSQLLYAAWKGSSGDERIWYSSFDGTNWAPQQSMPDPIATSFRPSLAVLNVGFSQLLYAAWKGSNDDTRIWYSSFDGTNWAPQKTISVPNTPNEVVGTDVGPSLAVLNGVLYAAWKGSNGDTRIWYSSLPGTEWETQKTISVPNTPNEVVGTDVGPSLAVFNGVLYAAWKGSNGDERIWYSSFDSTRREWETQVAIQSPVASSVGPSLAEFNNQLYAAWKGSDGDERIWYSPFNGNHFGLVGGPVQEPLPSPIASSVGPSLAFFNNRLYIAWKGSNGDTRIWWTSATD